MIKLLVTFGAMAFVLMFGAAALAVTATLYFLCMEALTLFLTVRDWWCRFWR